MAGKRRGDGDGNRGGGGGRIVEGFAWWERVSSGCAESASKGWTSENGKARKLTNKIEI